MKIMKSFIFIAVVMLVSLTMAQGQSPITPTTGKQVQDQAHKANSGDHTLLILITVEFGSPLLNCLYKGICRVDVHTQGGGRLTSDGSNPKGGAGTAGMVNDKLVVWFDPETITPENMKTHFADGVFTVSDPYELSKETTSALGIKQYTIKPGNYTATRTADGKLMVQF